MHIKIPNVLSQELKLLFSLSDRKRHWTIPFMAAISVGFPLIFGAIIGDFKPSLTVSLGGLVILYIPTKENIINRMSKMLICSLIFVISYIIGIGFSFNPIISSIVFGIYTAAVYFVTKMVRLAPPGNFFFIMIAAMASGLPFSNEQIPFRIGLITLGVLFACLVAFVFSLFVIKTSFKTDVKEVLSNDYEIRDVDYLEAFIIGFFMIICFGTAHLIGLENPYWVPISCLAVMQGVSRKLIWQRGFYRILGTVLGMLFCWVILLLVKTPVEIIIAIILLQYIIEVLVIKNYFFAVLLITPMTILLSDLGQPIYIEPNVLILSRLKDVLLGSLFGIFGGWVIYNEKLRYNVIRKIKITRKSLRN